MRMAINVKIAKVGDPEQLINPISKISGSKPVEKETTHWYLPLGEYENFIKNWFLKDKKIHKIKCIWAS